MPQGHPRARTWSALGSYDPICAGQHKFRKSTGQSAAYLPHIQGHAAVKRPTSRVADDCVQPGVLLAARLEQDVHVGCVTLLLDHDAGAVARLQHVDGVRVEGALGIRQAPVETDGDGTCGAESSVFHSSYIVHVACRALEVKQLQ
jgi:hypothetical protein